MGYPGIVLDIHGNEVQGFLFSSESLSDHWAELDEFEGEAYARVLTMVKQKKCSAVNSHIYQLRNSEPPRNSIDGS